MKNLLTILIILTSGLIYSQNADTLTVTKQYQYTAQKPHIIRTNTIVKFEADSIYLVNPGRYKFYEDLRQILDQDLSCNEIITAYQNSVEKNADLIGKLLLNSVESKKMTEQMLRDTNSALNYSFTLLAKNDILLENSLKNIETLKKELQKANRKKYLNYVIIGGSGILTGIIITKL